MGEGIGGGREGCLPLRYNRVRDIEGGQDPTYPILYERSANYNSFSILIGQNFLFRTNNSVASINCKDLEHFLNSQFWVPNFESRQPQQFRFCADSNSRQNRLRRADLMQDSKSAQKTGLQRLPALKIWYPKLRFQEMFKVLCL